MIVMCIWSLHDNFIYTDLEVVKIYVYLSICLMFR